MTDHPLQPRFDAVIAGLPDMPLRHARIATRGIGQGEQGDTLSVCWMEDLHAQVFLAGVGMVAQATAPAPLRDGSDIGPARVALWRDLRLAFLDWQRRQADG